MDGFFASPAGIALILAAQSLLVIGFVMISLLFLVYGDRKIWAAVQMRRGPNVVGAFGLLQSVADALKYVVKEIVVPAGRRQGGVLPRADAVLRAGDGRLGGDPVRLDLGAGRHQRRDPLCLRDLVARGLWRDHGGLGVELEVPVPRLAALGGADDLLRGVDRADHRRRDHLDRKPELRRDRAGAEDRLGPVRLVLAAASADGGAVLHLGAGGDQPAAVRSAGGGVGTRRGLPGRVFLDPVPACSWPANTSRSS